MIPSTHHSLLDAMRLSPNREGAWAAFSARYRDVILRWCQQRGLQLASAEDMTQEIMLKLHARLSSYDADKGAFRSWLKTVVNNALADWARRNRRGVEPAAVGASDFQNWLNNLADPRAVEELETEIERCAHATNEVFERVRARVSETSWQVFRLVAFEGRTAAEAAAELGLQVGNVYKISYRIKQMLRKELAND